MRKKGIRVVVSLPITYGGESNATTNSLSARAKEEKWTTTHLDSFPPRVYRKRRVGIK